MAKQKIKQEITQDELIEAGVYPESLIHTLVQYPTLKEVHFYEKGWSFDKHKSHVYHKTVSREEILNSVKTEE